MKRYGRAGSRVSQWTVTLIVVALSPAVLLFGELVSRHFRRRAQLRSVQGRPGRARWQRRLRRTGRPAVLLRYKRRNGVPAAEVDLGNKPRLLASRLITNPVWIALTAPARWIADRFRPRAGQRRGRGGPPSAGVREPRRPRPDQPAGAMALPEPQSH